MRDVNVRHRPLDFVLNVYKKFVKPSFEEFCFPVSVVQYMDMNHHFTIYNNDMIINFFVFLFSC